MLFFQGKGSCTTVNQPHTLAMDANYIVKSNWLTQKPHKNALDVVGLFAVLLLALSSSYFFGFLNAPEWMTATGDLVFKQHQWWRAWTTLFAHADFGHLIANSFLLFPLLYYLTSYYGLFLLPFLGIVAGGFINLIVLQTMKPDVTLLGISGVVNWYGALWLTLYFLIDRRESWRRRFARVLFITLVLFAPEAYKPEISYLSHFIGYIFGVLSGFLFYALNEQKFLKAEVREIIPADTTEPYIVPLEFVVGPRHGNRPGSKEWNTDN